MKPTNITRLLDAQHIPYTRFELSADKHSALETAQLLGVSPEVVFKTIVVLRETKGKPILALVPGPLEVNLKALAAAVGVKRLRLPSEREAEQLTGLQAGGISPLALLNQGFQIVIDATIQLSDEVHVSGGQRGLNLRLRAADLVALTGALVADISQ